MKIDIDRELQQLRQLTTTQLRQRYQETVGETARSSNKAWLIKRLAWRLQALAEGDLSERARHRAEELACDADLRLASPRPNQSAAKAASLQDHAAERRTPAPVRDPRLPPAGSLLTRSYKRQTIEVKVLQHGFDCQGRLFASLSALAKAITGTHCSGFRFFGLQQSQGGDR